MTEERRKLVEAVKKAEQAYYQNPTNQRRKKYFAAAEALRAYDAAHSEEPSDGGS